MNSLARPFPQEEAPAPWQLPLVPGIPPEAMTCFSQGVERLQAGDAAAALVPLSRAIEYAPDCSEAHVFVGLAHALTHNIYPAIDHLEVAAQLQPASFAAHFTLAQLSFKLRTPQKGYEAAERALRCITCIEQRKMLTELLREERAREHNGMRRPSFNKPFSASALWLAGGGLAAAVIAALLHMH